MPERLDLALAAAVAAAPAVAQPTVVVSPAPDRVSLTIYRDPYGRGNIDLRALGGFALVTETRRVRVPRGDAVIRFEGVAEGIVPVSAVVDGLPGGVLEKNRDARLLSPAALVDGTLGRQVTLTRTDRASGRRVSEDATIIAGPQRGVVLRTAAGVEALRCSGLPETLGFDRVPAGLSARPVLNVATRSGTSRTTTVQLTYLAGGFDWRASYVATTRADGRSLDLFVWLTLANGNGESFARAQVQAVAGRLNRVAIRPIQSAAASLRLSCFPLGTTTSNLRERRFEPADEIVVTASRLLAPPVVTMAYTPAPPAPLPPPPEDLGDLKLYRVPEQVTVRARGQKQVALLARSGVAFEQRYRARLAAGWASPARATNVTLVMRNRAEAGLGLPLPAGSTAVYAARQDGGRLLVGEGALDDRAEGEMLRIAAGRSSQVQVEQAVLSPREALLRATNANPFPVELEVSIGAAGQAIRADAGALAAIDGIATWSPALPPGGTAELRYRF